MSAPTGDPERLVADQPVQDTNEVMTEDVETPHHDEVTDEPVLPDSEADDDLVTEQETEQKHCRPMRARRPPSVLCYDQLGNPSYHPCNSQYFSWSNDVQSTLSSVVGCNAILLWVTKPSELWGPSCYVPVHPHAVPWCPLNMFQCMQFPVC